MKKFSKVVIFGATSTIAQQTARLFVSRGSSVFCIGRDPQKLQALLEDLTVRAGPNQHVDGASADLARHENRAELFDQAEAVLGGLDAVFIAHGTLPDQKACEQSLEKTLAELNTNALSVIALLLEAANRFERQGNGVIAVISSVAGDRGRQSNYVYGSAKGMVTLFMQGLRNRLYSHNVSVVTIKPGFVDTAMTDGMEKGGLLWSRPEYVARGIAQAMAKGKDVVYLPWFWRWVMLIIRLIPESIFKRLKL